MRALLLALLVASCSEAPAPKSAAELQAEEDRARIEAAQAAVRAVLRDPDSAQFTHTFISRKSGLPVVCGMVNARNAFGGYAGAMPYFSAGATASIASTENYRQFQPMWSDLCASEPTS